jgi:hypothetical protein
MTALDDISAAQNCKDSDLYKFEVLFLNESGGYDRQQNAHVGQE